MVSELVRFFLDPFHILLFLLIAAGLAKLMVREKLKWGFLGSALIWFLIASTPALPTILINSLEDRYEPVFVEQLPDPELEYHIIVLGSGHGFDDRLPANSLLSLGALGRLSEGIRLYHQLPNSTLILSGYSASGRTTQAEMLQNAAIVLGVDEGRTLLQTEPSNTFEEAQIYASRFGRETPVIVVTSASHMPRAMMVFNRFEISPIASPANYRLKGSWKDRRFGLPSLSNMNLLRTAFYEYAAIMREKWR